MPSQLSSSRASLLRGLLLSGVAVMALAGAAQAAGPAPTVKVLDNTFDVGAGTFAYTEYELSGEPLAENQGLNLDVLDADQADKPDPFDFAAGIDSYEYSEEAMYAVNYQSHLGPHLVNGPVNAMTGGTFDSLGKRFIHLAQLAGLAPDELPQNPYPITFPLDKGVPEFGQPVDVTQVGTDSKDITTHQGQVAKIATITPAYFRDFVSRAWRRRDGMDMNFTPIAVGGQMLKDVMWSQDFLGSMHKTCRRQRGRRYPVAGRADHDGKPGARRCCGRRHQRADPHQHHLGQAADALRDKFGYDGKTLGAAIGPDYDPAKQPIWFPDKVAVTFAEKNGVNALGDLKVTDAGSSLRSTWMLLWPLSELYGFTDQRTANGNKSNAFLAVFDGDPFPPAPAANLGTDATKYVKADDPFSLAETLSNLEFKNLVALHFNKAAGTVVDDWKDGKQGQTVTTFDAAYTISALDIYERALDALPVGYASASSGKPLATTGRQDRPRPRRRPRPISSPASW